jgi:hypothetical protein
MAAEWDISLDTVEDGDNLSRPIEQESRFSSLQRSYVDGIGGCGGQSEAMAFVHSHSVGPSVGFPYAEKSIMEKSLFSVLVSRQALRTYLESKGIGEYCPSTDRYLYFRHGRITINLQVGFSELTFMKAYFDDREMVDITFAFSVDDLLKNQEFSDFLDAVVDPRLWPLCLSNPWAQELASHMLAL